MQCIACFYQNLLSDINRNRANLFQMNMIHLQPKSSSYNFKFAPPALRKRYQATFLKISATFQEAFSVLTILHATVWA